VDKVILGALLVALGSGVAIGVQSTFNSLSGRLAGAVNTGLLVTIAGGSFSLLVLAFLVWRNQAFPWEGVRAAALYWAGAGVMGTAIIMGIAFSLPHVGIAAGLAAIILGQMLTAVVIDTFGWGGSRIPLDVSRILGLVLLVAATWLLLPRR